jgi:hypothetical protein
VDGHTVYAGEELARQGVEGGRRDSVTSRPVSLPEVGLDPRRRSRPGERPRVLRAGRWPHARDRPAARAPKNPSAGMGLAGHGWAPIGARPGVVVGVLSVLSVLSVWSMVEAKDGRSRRKEAIQ